MEVYFTDIPNIGDLSLEHIFYQYEEPILFVCVDASGKRYLCSCCRLSENWIIRQVEDADLIDMIDNCISLDKMFRFADHKTLFLSWDGERMTYSFDVPEKAYPRSGSFLELSRSKTDSYRERLKQRAETSGWAEQRLKLEKSCNVFTANTLIPVVTTIPSDMKQLLNDHVFSEGLPENLSNFTRYVPYQYSMEFVLTAQPDEQSSSDDKNETAEKTVSAAMISSEPQDIDGEDTWLNAA